MLNSILKGTFSVSTQFLKKTHGDIKIITYFPSRKNNALKTLQFNTFQTNLVFHEIFVYMYDVRPVNALRIFYIDINTVQHFKK